MWLLCWLEPGQYFYSGAMQVSPCTTKTVVAIPMMMFQSEQRHDIKETFDSLDTGGTGETDAKELNVATSDFGFEHEEEEIQKTSSDVDDGGSPD